MRRLVALLLVALGLVAAGCSSADGQHAQELLTQAQAAEQNLKSARFELELNATFDGQQAAMTMRGGGYMKGRRAGDMFLQASGSGAVGAFDFSLIKVGERAYLNMNGDRREMPFPASLETRIPSQNFGSAAFLELARYVKKVKVASGGLIGHGRHGRTRQGAREAQRRNGAGRRLGAGRLDVRRLLRGHARRDRDLRSHPPRHRRHRRSPCRRLWQADRPPARLPAARRQHDSALPGSCVEPASLPA